MKSLITSTFFLFLITVLFAQDRAYPYSENEKWGIVSKDGRILLSPGEKDYQYIHPFYFNGKGAQVAVAHSKDDKRGLIDEKGNAVIPLVYDEVILQEKAPRLVALGVNGKRGLATTKGEILVPLSFDRLWRFSGGKMPLAVFKKGTERGVVDAKGKIIFKEERVSIKTVVHQQETYFRVVGNDRTEYFNCKGKSLKKPDFLLPVYKELDKAPDFGEGEYYAGSHVLSYFYEPTLNGVIVKAEYSHEYSEPVIFREYFFEGYDEIIFHHGELSENKKSETLHFVIARKGEQYFSLNADGEQLVPFYLDKVKLGRRYVPRVLEVFKDGKMGFMDVKTGKLIVPPIYDAVLGNAPDKEGMYLVKLGNIMAWANADGIMKP